jgi:hypothetical protein
MPIQTSRSKKTQAAYKIILKQISFNQSCHFRISPPDFTACASVRFSKIAALLSL